MNTILNELNDRYILLLEKAKRVDSMEVIEQANSFLKEIIDIAETIFNPEQRNILSSMARSLGEVIYNATGEYPSVSIRSYKEVGPSIPFINRENEIATVLSTFASSYFLIDAPDGYGKTQLLLELNRRFDQMDWLCAYIPAPQPMTPENLLTSIAEKLEIELLQNGNLPQSYRLIGSLGNRWTREPRSGLAILIDFKDYEVNIVEFLIREFIPHLDTSLRALRFFAEEPGRFKVIIAGRHISSVLSMLPDYRFRIVFLAPFSYELIRVAVARILVNFSEESNRQLAAHLTHLTGGHPRSVAFLLNQYLSQGLSPDLFVEYEGKRIIDMILETTEGILHNIPEKLKKIVLTLSVFRFVDYSLLKSLLSDDAIPEFNDVYQLADTLVSLHLYVRQQRFLYNSGMRRLLAINLMYKDIHQFQELSDRAKMMSLERLRVEHIQTPELWAIEYLFQVLQFYTNQIQQNSVRRSIREEFFSKDLPQVLDLLFERVPKHERDVEKYALLQQIDRDWEFSFTVNYYLRDNLYSDEPFTELRNRINQYFHDSHSL